MAAADEVHKQGEEVHFRVAYYSTAHTRVGCFKHQDKFSFVYVLTGGGSSPDPLAEVPMVHAEIGEKSHHVIDVQSWVSHILVSPSSTDGRPVELRIDGMAMRVHALEHVMYVDAFSCSVTRGVSSSD